MTNTIDIAQALTMMRGEYKTLGFLASLPDDEYADVTCCECGEMIYDCFVDPEFSDYMCDSCCGWVVKDSEPEYDPSDDEYDYAEMPEPYSVEVSA